MRLIRLLRINVVAYSFQAKDLGGFGGASGGMPGKRSVGKMYSEVEVSTNGS